jgi:hypothetical protein
MGVGTFNVGLTPLFPHPRPTPPSPPHCTAPRTRLAQFLQSNKVRTRVTIHIHFPTLVLLLQYYICSSFQKPLLPCPFPSYPVSNPTQPPLSPILPRHWPPKKKCAPSLSAVCPLTLPSASFTSYSTVVRASTTPTCTQPARVVMFV